MNLLIRIQVLILTALCLAGPFLAAQSTADKLVATAQIGHYEGFGGLANIDRKLVDKLPFALNYFDAESGVSFGAPYVLYSNTRSEKPKATTKTGKMLDNFGEGVSEMINKEREEKEGNPEKPDPLPVDSLLSKEQFRAMTRRLGKLFGTDYDMIHDSKQQGTAFGTTQYITTMYAVATVDAGKLGDGPLDRPKNLQYPVIQFKQRSSPTDRGSMKHQNYYYIFSSAKPVFPYLNHPKADLTGYSWGSMASPVPEHKELVSIRKAQLRGNPKEVKEYTVSPSGEKQLSQHMKFNKEGIMTFQLYQEGSNWLKKQIRPTAEDSRVRSFSMGVDLLDQNQEETGKSFGASYWFNKSGDCTKSNEGNGVSAHELEYNDAGLLARSVANGVTTEFRYNRHRQITSMSRGGVTVEMDYDLLGRLSTVKVCQDAACKAGSITHLEWDDANHRMKEKTTLIHTGQIGADITYRFNDKGLVSSMEDSQARVRYTYEVDKAGNWVKRTTRIAGDSPSEQVHVREIDYQE